MAKNGKATYCVFTKEGGSPIIDESSIKKMDETRPLFWVADWSSVDFSNVKIVKFGGVGNKDTTISDKSAYLNRLNQYNAHNFSQTSVMYPIKAYDNGVEMRETELHKFIKKHPEVTGLKWGGRDANKNEWYQVSDPSTFKEWIVNATKNGGKRTRTPNITTKSQERVLKELSEIKSPNKFLYASMRFRKSGTALEYNRRYTKANLMIVISPISDSMNSYRGVIDNFSGFEDYEFITSDEYGADVNLMKSDISMKLKSGKTVALFCTWNWFKNGKDFTASNFTDGIDGVKKVFPVLDEFHNSSDTESSMNIIDMMRQFGDVETLYMSGTPFNELINNSGLNATKIFDPKNMVVFDLADLLRSEDYEGFEFNHYNLNRVKLEDLKKGMYTCNWDCDFNFNDDGKRNSFSSFAEKCGVLAALESRKVSICYMRDLRNCEVATKYFKTVFKGNKNWKVFNTDDDNTKYIIRDVEDFVSENPNGHCVIVTCNKLVMGATIKHCDGIHFMRYISSLEFALQAEGRSLTLCDGKTSVGIYYYDDKDFWNLRIQFDNANYETSKKLRKTKSYKNGQIVFEHIYFGVGAEFNEIDKNLILEYISEYKKLATSNSVDDYIICNCDVLDTATLELEGKKTNKSDKKVKGGVFSGDNPHTPTMGKDTVDVPQNPNEGGNDEPSDDDGNPQTGTSEESNPQKVKQFMYKNLGNYMQFAAFLFSNEELNRFNELSNEFSSENNYDTYEISCSLMYDNSKFDEYFNTIRQMKTHLKEDGWMRLCDTNRCLILNKFYRVLNSIPTENIIECFTENDREIVNELYERNFI